MPRWAVLAAHWLHEPQPTIDQPVGSGFPHLAGGIHPEDVRFRPWVIGFVHVRKDL